MKITELMNLINEIESKFKVEKWTIDQIHIWPIIRMDLMHTLFDIKARKQQTKINLLFKIREGIKIIGGLLKYLKATIRDKKNNAKIEPKEIVFLSDGISRVKLHGKNYEKFCDPFSNKGVHYDMLRSLINKDLENKPSHITLEPLHRYIIPRYRKSVFIQTRLDYSLIKNYLFKSRQPSKEQLPGFEDFINFLKEKRFNTPLPDITRIRVILSAISAYSKVFELILEKIKPKLGLVVCYYGPIGLAFILACKKMGIPSVDIQHGAEGEFHPAYGRWNKLPPHSYELLPDYFWCWTDNEVKAIEQWNKKNNHSQRAIKGGNLFLNMWLDETNEIVKYYDQKIIQHPKFNNDKKNILLTLSYDYDNEEILKPTIGAMKKFQSDRCWWIRLHPAALNKRKEIYEMLKKNNIKHFELELATNLPLYAILRHMDLHITHTSGTVVEAEVFKVPSIVTSENSIYYYTNQITNGFAIYAKTTYDIEKAIQKQLILSNNLKSQTATT